MAGHNKGAMHQDPALIRYNSMWTNRHKYFRWTPRTAWITFVYMVLVPLPVGIAGYMTEGKYNMRGKRRGDLISEY
ncbi:uncharacterized protein BDR25DRAFT_304261 [Lindgomyces ingoldianus]|uniref:Uncharacterized protein n=1 Tax=Lindgomyces ingoldianus TaxID=673940 RepID=A0ACB6QS92_9PLEO|nr:uncharacterized protein BDR25DRAFT_304261 [Lindgomyces ingoldianus]KAF2469858.1 hypothetical protein BDR25DRAFT_304261 [Lindgomyces ingoldianus]